MDLKNELEILRGEPIELRTGNPMDIPCIETSDPDKLCKHPVVSVSMITYNHEPYIRQAIEGVMMQKTDFEFELIIGEDCSQDKTREICFEYQKKYPDKIRVLWWHENVRKLGGNGRRCAVRRRGEFVALCEGDDYWIDPLKLKKQVDIMRRNPNVGICFGLVDIFYQGSGKVVHPDQRRVRSGVVDGKEFCKWLMLEQNPNVRNMLQTSGNMVRAAVSAEAEQKFWVRRAFGYDLCNWLGAGSVSDVYFLPEIVSTYRINAGGITKTNFSRVMMDGDSIIYAFLREAFDYSPEEALRWTAKRFVRMWVNKAAILPRGEQRKVADQINAHPLLRQIFHRPYSIFMLLAIRLGVLNQKRAFWLNRIFWYLPRLGKPWKVRSANV